MKNILFLSSFLFNDFIEMVDGSWRFFYLSMSLSIPKTKSSLEIDGSRKMDGVVRIAFIKEMVVFLSFS